jgi:ABC-type glycerol-3-phosphate transport system substrate-binding protein
MSFSTPEGLQSLKFIKDWFDKKWAPPAVWSSTQPNEDTNPFVRGTTAMGQLGQWNITYLDENIKQNFKWHVTFTPRAKTQVTSLGGTPVVGWSKTKYKPEVGAFLEFFTSTEQVKQFDELANYMPVRNDLLDQKINYRTRADLMGVFQQQIKFLPPDFVAYTSRSYSGGIGTIIREEATKMGLQGQSPEDTAKNIDARGNKFIQENPDVEGL